MNASALAASLLLAATPFAALADDYDDLRARLNAAYEARDTAVLAAAAAEALSMRPGHPTLSYFAAYADAAEGRPEAALDAMFALYARDVLPLQPKADAAVFESMYALPRAARLADERARLLVQVGAPEAQSVPQPAGQVPEGVAVARNGRVFLSSVRDGGIAARFPDGVTHRWATPPGSTLGVHLDAAQRVLWVAVAPFPEYAGVGAAVQTGLAALDAMTGELRAWHPLAAHGAHGFGDFVLLDDGTAVATDSLGGGAWRLGPATGWQPIPALAGLRAPQGVTQLGDALIIADYGRGLYRYAPATGAITRIADGAGAPYGIDGLYAHGDALVAVQNGVLPHRVTRFVLDAAVTRIERATPLLMNHPAFDEPTLGQVDGDRFHVVANSHWNRFTREHALPEGLSAPVVLTLTLPDA